VGQVARTPNSLLQAAVPHRDDLARGLLGGEGVVDRPLGKAEAVLGALEHFELVFGVDLVERRLQLAGNVFGDCVVFRMRTSPRYRSGDPERIAIVGITSAAPARGAV